MQNNNNLDIHDQKQNSKNQDDNQRPHKRVKIDTSNQDRDDNKNPENMIEMDTSESQAKAEGLYSILFEREYREFVTSSGETPSADEKKALAKALQAYQQRSHQVYYDSYNRDPLKAIEAKPQKYSNLTLSVSQFLTIDEAKKIAASQEKKPRISSIRWHSSLMREPDALWTLLTISSLTNLEFTPGFMSPHHRPNSITNISSLASIVLTRVIPRYIGDNDTLALLALLCPLSQSTTGNANAPEKKVNRTLTSLQRCFVDMEPRKLLSYLPNFVRLKNLELTFSDNAFPDIVKVLPQLRELSTFSAFANADQEKNCHALMQAIANHPTLTALELTGIPQYFQYTSFLKNNQHLTALYFDIRAWTELHNIGRADHESIDKKCMLAGLHGLSENKHIRKLEISSTSRVGNLNISIEGVQLLSKMTQLESLALPIRVNQELYIYMCLYLMSSLRALHVTRVPELDRGYEEAVPPSQLLQISAECLGMMRVSTLTINGGSSVLSDNKEDDAVAILLKNPDLKEFSLLRWDLTGRGNTLVESLNANKQITALTIQSRPGLSVTNLANLKKKDGLLFFKSLYMEPDSQSNNPNRMIAPRNRYVNTLPNAYVDENVLRSNRSFLENLQKVFILLLSQRANAESPIKDSILNLIPGITDFLNNESNDDQEMRTSFISKLSGC
jgi:hypothetical protein